MGFYIPGFPTEVSETIEFPDIAEMLLHPMFRVATPETLRKYGTEFQKELLDKTPLKNNTKHVTIWSVVNVIDNGQRVMTNYDPKRSNSEWHIDGCEIDDAFDHIYPIETCHLLLSYTTALTQFNKNKINFTGEVEKYNISEFHQYLNRINLNELITPQSIEPNKIYTFSNHLHRAVPPNRIEFRYTWRVRETNKEYIPKHEMSQMIIENTAFDIHKQDWFSNLIKEHHNHKISIYFPAGVWNYFNKNMDVDDL
ncbi:hypothetical protein [Chengkuizengella axinellae]|uniref:Uncharacterized protein n=1 Tax=Chengkuizengella axinellae TaxID=3064388 RepID=A0ABT9IWE9_9BACL|nr:hypothetical protein [Chengkuizengella sp. 2205SS18-9]MDP5273694.1 hypothetical protein [Chengkuizengella sp. 2205SS18-9]